MKKFVALNRDEVPVVNHITPDDIIGFSFGKNPKGFVKASQHTLQVIESTHVVLLSAEGIERHNSWNPSGIRTWKETIEWLINNDGQIFVFDNSKELLKWLAE